MNTAFWHELGDKGLLKELGRTLGLPADKLDPRVLEDLELLRQKVREGDWLMEVRETCPEALDLEKNSASVGVLLTRTRAFLVSSSGNRAVVACPDGSSAPTPTETMLSAFDEEAMAPVVRRRRQWKRRGVSDALTRRVERQFGPDGCRALSCWLDSQPERDAAAVLDMVIRHPSLAPFALEPDTISTPPWLEIRFAKMVQLSEKRSPWRSVLGMIAQESGLLLLIVGLTILAAPVGFAMAMAAAFVMDYSPTALQTPWQVFYLMLALFVFGKALALTQQYASARLGGRLSWRLKRSFILRVLNARISTVRNLGDGDLYTRLNDLSTIQNFLTGRVLSVLSGIATLTGGTIYLFLAAPFVILPTLVGCSLVAAFLIWYVPRLRALRWNQLTTLSTYRDRVLERLEGRRVFKHVDGSGLLFRRIDRYLMLIADYTQQGTKLGARLSVVASVVGIFYIGFVTWLVANRYQEGQASLGSLTVVIGLSVSAFQAALRLMNLAPAVVGIEPAVVRVQEVIHATPSEPLIRGQIERSKSACDLVVRDLRFTWGESLPLLRGVSLHLEPGSWNCLVGSSGCGKSTLAGILGGLLEPESGTIVLDDCSLEGYAPTELRNRIALLTQETFLFSRTIRENITMGWTGSSEKIVRSIVQLTGLKEFVGRQPRGLDQNVGDNGTRLSQGEKSRICLARALLRSPGLVILDEALARLDCRTREVVQSGLRAAGVTVLILTHDLSQARTCDRVFVLNDGRITESGTFEELYRNKSAFGEIYRTKNEHLPKNWSEG